MAVLDFVNIGSSITLRQFACLGSSISVFSGTRFGGRLSMLDMAHLASSFSLRSFANVGSAVAAGAARAGAAPTPVLDLVSTGPESRVGPPCMHTHYQAAPRPRRRHCTVNAHATH